MMKQKKVKNGSEVNEEAPHYTIWDVARHSGVSIATVSRVLNGKPYVTAATREKVMESVQELSYRGRQAQAYEEREHTGFIGLTSASMRGSEYTEIIAGITEALHARNARPVICPISRRHNCGMTLLERLMYGATDGALVLGSTDTDEELTAAYMSGFPFVVVNPNGPINAQIPVVASSNWHGARAATEHLLSLGHTRICAITTNHRKPGYQFDAADRQAGFQSALLAAGLPFTPELVYKAEENTKDGGYRTAHHILEQTEQPTAIFAFSDALAAGVLQAAQERGLNVPRDLSIVGFGDMEFSRLLTPELTTVHQPFQEMGRISVDMLYQIISGLTLDATRVELSTRLVVRASTAPLYDHLLHQNTKQLG